jgi:hypothetical protein
MMLPLIILAIALLVFSFTRLVEMEPDKRHMERIGHILQAGGASSILLGGLETGLWLIIGGWTALALPHIGHMLAKGKRHNRV